MDLADVPLPLALELGGWAIALTLLAWAVRRGDWSPAKESAAVHAFLGAVALVVVLWSIRGQVGTSFAFHLLGTAGLALASGFARSLVAGALVVALTTLIRESPPANAALVWLTLVVVPAAIATAGVAAIGRFLPANFFIYVFAGCFFGAGVALAAGALAGAALLALAGGTSGPPFAEYAPFLVYLAFGEATLTGMLMTLAVVYKPEWVATFDDARYLDR